ncbi:hypothetical protein [Mucilaginibacter sp. HD30]
MGLKDDEYEVWSSVPIDTNTRLSDLKTIDGENLEEWIKLHPLYPAGK